MANVVDTVVVHVLEQNGFVHYVIYAAVECFISFRLSEELPCRRYPVEYQELHFVGFFSAKLLMRDIDLQEGHEKNVKISWGMSQQMTTYVTKAASQELSTRNTMGLSVLRCYGTLIR